MFLILENSCLLKNSEAELTPDGVSKNSCGIFSRSVFKKITYLQLQEIINNYTTFREIIDINSKVIEEFKNTFGELNLLENKEILVCAGVIIDIDIRYKILKTLRNFKYKYSCLHSVL